MKVPTTFGSGDNDLSIMLIMPPPPPQSAWHTRNRESQEGSMKGGLHKAHKIKTQKIYIWLYNSISVHDNQL